MTIHTALQQGKQLLQQAGVDSPRLTAEVLLSYAIRCERQWLIAHATDELQEVWWIHYGRYLHERMQGRPTQQITKRQEFYGREFRLTSDVLIPRPETEHVVEAAIALLREPGSSSSTARVSVLDVGTGSGAIAVTLALEANVVVTAVDLSSAALHVAADNVRRLDARQVRLVQGDLASAFATAAFDLVVSNPPYVALRDKDGLQREVRDFEPELALFGGDDGLDVYRLLIPDAQRVLKPGGWLVLEIGQGQSEAIHALLTSSGLRGVLFREDLAGVLRVAIAQRGDGVTG